MGLSESHSRASCNVTSVLYKLAFEDVSLIMTVEAVRQHAQIQPCSDVFYCERAHTCE